MKSGHWPKELVKQITGANREDLHSLTRRSKFCTNVRTSVCEFIRLLFEASADSAEQLTRRHLKKERLTIKCDHLGPVVSISTWSTKWRKVYRAICREKENWERKRIERANWERWEDCNHGDCPTTVNILNVLKMIGSFCLLLSIRHLLTRFANSVCQLGLPIEDFNIDKKFSGPLRT